MDVYSTTFKISKMSTKVVYRSLDIFVNKDSNYAKSFFFRLSQKYLYFYLGLVNKEINLNHNLSNYNDIGFSL